MGHEHSRLFADICLSRLTFGFVAGCVWPPLVTASPISPLYPIPPQVCLAIAHYAQPTDPRLLFGFEYVGKPYRPPAGTVCHSECDPSW